MEPKISVIIPVYNVEKYLQTCIDSLLGQTMKDIEFIFVNDASPDNSLEILERNRKVHPDQIRVIDSKINLNIGGARNLGLRAARAPLIGFLDSDDFANPRMYQQLYCRMIETDADAVFTQFAYVPESATLDSIKYENYSPAVTWSKKILEFENVDLDGKILESFIWRVIGTTWTGLWKKSLIVDNDVWFPEHLRYEDNYFISLLRPYIKKVSFVPGIHVYYRYVPTSTVHSQNAVHHFDRIAIENKLLEETKKRGLFDKYYAAWEYIYITRYVFNTSNLFACSFARVPMEQLYQIKNDLKKNFPKWYKNEYLSEDQWFSFKTKVLLFMPLPLMVMVFRLIKSLKAILKKFLRLKK